MNTVETTQNILIIFVILVLIYIGTNLGFFDMPTINLPNVDLPTINLPTIELPAIQLPNIAMPSICPLNPNKTN
jgi:hypothetical protein